MHVVGASKKKEKRSPEALLVGSMMINLHSNFCHWMGVLHFVGWCVHKVLLARDFIHDQILELYSVFFVVLSLGASQSPGLVISKVLSMTALGGHETPLQTRKSLVVSLPGVFAFKQNQTEAFTSSA